MTRMKFNLGWTAWKFHLVNLPDESLKIKTKHSRKRVSEKSKNY